MRGPRKQSRQLTFVSQIFFTDVMPKTATGKVQRRLVAEAMLKQSQKAKL